MCNKCCVMLLRFSLFVLLCFFGMGLLLVTYTVDFVTVKGLYLKGLRVYPEDIFLKRAEGEITPPIFRKI